MKSSKSASKYKRARPVFGTLLSVELESEQDANEIITRAFARAEALEQIFSKFRPDSDLMRFNSTLAKREVEISAPLAEVLQLALELFSTTRGGFNPFVGEPNEVDLMRMNNRWFARKAQPCELDLSGIAKGYAVDQICEMIQAELPGASGSVNAGGDLRFINVSRREINLRSAANPSSLRKIVVSHESVATSSFSECRGNPLSSTNYTQSPRSGLDESCSVTVMAEDCAIADALTKAVWFSEEGVVPECVKLYGAHALIFDGQGEELGRFG